MNKLLPMVCLLFTFSHCQQVEISGLDEVKREKASNEIRTMLNDYFQDIKREGLIAEFRYLDNSPDFFWVPPGYNSAISYDSVYKTLQINNGSLKSIHFYWDTLSIYPLSEQIANYTGIVKGTIVDTAGNTSQVKMIETGTTFKRPDGWKILSGQSRNLE